MILLKNKNKKANIKIGNNIEIKDGNDFPFDLTLYGKSTQATRSGKNLYNNADIVATSDASIIKSSTGFTATRTSSSTGDLFLGSYEKQLKPNTTYTFYENRTNGSTCYFYSDNLFGTALTRNIVKSTDTLVIYTFTTDSTGKVVIGFYSASQTQGDTVTLSNIMLLEGSYTSETIPEYEPYGVMPSPDYPSPIESITEISATVTGKNLFDKDNAPSINAYVDTSTNKIAYQNTSIATYLEIQPNTTYTISKKVGQTFRVATTTDTPAYNVSILSTTANHTGASITITTEANAHYLFIHYFNTGNTGTQQEFLNTIMVEENTQATDYEQYKSNSLTINLQGNELCSLPNGTKDEVNITNGEALLTKRIDKVILTGSENWTLYSNKTHTFSLRMGQTIDKHDIAYCSHFTEISPDKFDVATGIYSAYTNNIIISYLDCDTVDEFKTWLSTHNVEVLYELAEPETINLGTVEMPHTYEGVSNITNSADTEMVVKYYKKFEFDKILRSGYNIDEQEYEIAIKQMANGKRKKILSSYVDCIIKIDLGLLDNKTYQEYKEPLEDGEYEYWSYKYNQYKKANFILTKPSITTEYAYDDDIGIDDMEITLEKSSDVS